MSIVRCTHDKENPFTLISNAALRDARLSFKARGVLALLLSYPDDWNLNIGHLAAQSEREGPTAVRSAIDELSGAGYLIQERVKDASGRFTPFRKIVLETPIFRSMVASSETVTVEASQQKSRTLMDTSSETVTVQATQATKKGGMSDYPLMDNPPVENPVTGSSTYGNSSDWKTADIINNQNQQSTKLKNISPPTSSQEPNLENPERERIFESNLNLENSDNQEPAQASPREPASTAPSLRKSRDLGLDQNSGGGAADIMPDVREAEVVEVKKEIVRREDPRLGFNSRREALQQRVQGQQYPEGVWMRDGLLNEDFVEWLAQDWLAFKSSKGCIHKARANVRAHFLNEPEKLPIRWEEYHSKFGAKVANVIVRQQSGGTIGDDEKQNLIQHQAALTPLAPEHAVAATPAPVQDYAQHLVADDKPALLKSGDNPIEVVPASNPPIAIEPEASWRERVPVGKEGEIESPEAYRLFVPDPTPDVLRQQQESIVPSDKPVDFNPEQDHDKPSTAEEFANLRRLYQEIYPIFGRVVPAQAPQAQVKNAHSERQQLIQALGNMYGRIATGCQRWMSQDADQLLLAWQKAEWNLRPTVRSLLAVGKSCFEQLGLRIEGDELIEEF